MAEKHTPGPWEGEYDESEESHVIRMATAIENPARYSTVHVWECRHGLSDDEEHPKTRQRFEESEANMRLMASAPDLLAALESMLTAWDDECPDCKCACCAPAPDDIVSPAPCSMCMARAAIAKAKGE
ncbi:MAG: hypothetical protein IT428_29140 [Planctomycetaceae bacterium]|nr:hypothetical protein [Planctomycetaceae bacterium]